MEKGLEGTMVESKLLLSETPEMGEAEIVEEE